MKFFLVLQADRYKMIKRLNTGTTYVTNIRKSQWEQPMREFCKKRTAQCKPQLEDETFFSSSTKLVTGSQYDGDHGTLGMTGYGEYMFPNGVIYKGEFKDGMFNGYGELWYDTDPDYDAVVSGMWENGTLDKQSFLFSNCLEYTQHDWSYCKMPDRRYAAEYHEGLQPPGKEYITPEKPSREIPPGYYDTGDGFYNASTKVIYDYSDLSSILRAPVADEQKWIERNCRMSPVVQIGPSPELYEEWQNPTATRASQPAPAAYVKLPSRLGAKQSTYSTFEIKLRRTFSVDKKGTVESRNEGGLDSHGNCVTLPKLYLFCILILDYYF